MCDEREPVSGLRIIGTKVMREGGFWVRCTYVRGWHPELEGVATPVTGWTGPEMEFRTVISPAAVSFTVHEAELQRQAMIAKWDKDGWLDDRKARVGASRKSLDRHKKRPTAA